MLEVLQGALDELPKAGQKLVVEVCPNVLPGEEVERRSPEPLRVGGMAVVPVQSDRLHRDPLG